MPHIDRITVPPGDGHVTWMLNSAEVKGEFQIWFPESWTPLLSGKDTSKGGTLTRKLKSKVERGKGTVYPYAMFLLETHEMVDSTSPPVIIIE